MTRKYLLTFVGLFLSFSFSVAFAITDRALVEINKATYTQRQFEIYMLVREAVQGVRRPVVFLDARNWKEEVERFRKDMMVEQEALRLSSVTPSKKNVDQVVEAYQAGIQKFPRLKSWALSLKLDEGGLRRAAARYIRVRAFVQGKERQSGASMQNVADLSELNPRSEWYMRLEQRVPYRFYDDAQTMQTLESP